MPEALRIFSLDKNEKVVGYQELVKILDPTGKYKNQKVVVVAAAGKLRSGKSFVLNYVIKYLRSGGSPDWLESSLGDLTGFDWRQSSSPGTNGVLLWPEVFQMRQDNGETIAVLVMDTQGLNPRATSSLEGMSIVFYSLLLSSIQIYNVPNDLKGAQLEELQRFGNLVADGNSVTPCVELVFLVRDWGSPHEYPYGWEGGQCLFERQFMAKDKQLNGIDPIGRTIRKTFSTTRCYLLDTPGKLACESPKFTGRVDEMNPDFVKHLKQFVEGLLAPKNLITKKVKGVDITLDFFLRQAEAYAPLFHGGTVPSSEMLKSVTNNILRSL